MELVVDIEAGTIDLPPMTIDALQCDALIQQLARVRSQLQPQPPPDPRQAHHDVTPQTAPAFKIGRNPLGGITLALRHQGLGWTFWVLTDEDAVAIQLQLRRETGYDGKHDPLEGDPGVGHAH